LNYQGSNERLRIRLHNFDAGSVRNSYRDTLRGLDVSFRAQETRAPVSITTKGWALAQSSSSDTQVMDISLDLVAPISAGNHELELEYIEFYGELLPASQWYLGVALRSEEHTSELQSRENL